ncbi:MAG: UDP-N-acetylmuramate dehydrogenase [Planctomycetota bacterium]
MSWWRGFESFIRPNAPLAGMTTYRVGGSAELLAEPTDVACLGALLVRAADENIPVRLLGGGSNVLIADTGVRGLVIHLPRTAFGSCSQNEDCILVGAGHSLPTLVNWTAAQGLRGLECLRGVPGTVGAAIRMNAGGKYGEIARYVRRVRGFEGDGRPFNLTADECEFEYRNSNLRDRIVTECELQLSAGDPQLSRYLTQIILREKSETQPLQVRSAGCVFKNPQQPDVPPAGRLIDEAGLKGWRVGGASVSRLHANFLICEGQTTADDLAQLIRLIRQRVYAAREVKLELEVNAWGFEPEELQPPNWKVA